MHCWGDVNWYSHQGKQYEIPSKKSKTELPYDPAAPLLGFYLKKEKTIGKDTCTPTSTAALFVIAHLGAHQWLNR